MQFLCCDAHLIGLSARLTFVHFIDRFRGRTLLGTVGFDKERSPEHYRVKKVRLANLFVFLIIF